MPCTNGMHSPSRLEASLRNSRGKSPSTAIKQNLCPLLCSVSCMSLSTQLLALVQLLSRCYAPAAYPECHCQNTTAISCTLDRCTRSGCHSWISFITVVIQLACCQSIKLYENVTYITLNYSVKNTRNDVRQKIYEILQ